MTLLIMSLHPSLMPESRNSKVRRNLSVPVYVSPISRHLLVKCSCGNKCTHNRIIVGHVIFYAIHVKSQKSFHVCMCIIARQWDFKHVPIVTKTPGQSVFYAAHVVSNKSRQLVLPELVSYLHDMNTYIQIWS
jgi:hypothetical protein